MDQVDTDKNTIDALDPDTKRGQDSQPGIKQESAEGMVPNRVTARDRNTRPATKEVPEPIKMAKERAGANTETAEAAMSLCTMVPGNKGR
jgi:hypothetical protein